MNDACRAAHHERWCLNYHVDYKPKNKKGPDNECDVYDVRPEIGTPVTIRTRVSLTVRCGDSEEDTSQTNPDTTGEEDTSQTNPDTTDRKEGRPDESRHDRQEERPDDPDTTDKKKNERGG